METLKLKTLYTLIMLLYNIDLMAKINTYRCFFLLCFFKKHYRQAKNLNNYFV